MKESDFKEKKRVSEDFLIYRELVISELWVREKEIIRIYADRVLHLLSIFEEYNTEILSETGIKSVGPAIEARYQKSRR